MSDSCCPSCGRADGCECGHDTDGQEPSQFAAPSGSAYYGCSCGDAATAEKSPCGWVIHCNGRELEGLCGAHTANTHSTVEEAQAEWVKLGGKVYTPNTEVRHPAPDVNK